MIDNAKTFFIKEDVFCPNEINKKLGKFYRNLKNNTDLKGEFYILSDGKIIRYHFNLFQIFSDDNEEINEIKFGLEKILKIELLGVN